MLLTTPATIRTLQRKLYAKAKQEPAYRFYALYDKIDRDDVLSHAWRLVRANRGSPGVDGISFEAIESGIGVETFLRELAQDRPTAQRRLLSTLPFFSTHDLKLDPVSFPLIT